MLYEVITLFVYDFRPSSDPRGIVIAGHAMMVDAQTLCRRDRATLVWILVRAGFRVLVPDLRGHGQAAADRQHRGPRKRDVHEQRNNFV